MLHIIYRKLVQYTFCEFLLLTVSVVLSCLLVVIVCCLLLHIKVNNSMYLYLRCIWVKNGSSAMWHIWDWVGNGIGGQKIPIRKSEKRVHCCKQCCLRNGYSAIWHIWDWHGNGIGGWRTMIRKREKSSWLQTLLQNGSSAMWPISKWRKKYTRPSPRTGNKGERAYG